MEITHALSEKQNRALASGHAKQFSENYGDTTLTVTDEGPDEKELIHVYNILELRHEVTQPPNFPRFVVPPCPRGQKFSHTSIPRFIRNRYCKPGTSEYYYQREDGRKSANSLLNPLVHPASQWEQQFLEIAAGDQRISPDAAVCGLASNLNAFGVFWSMTPPDDPTLADELELAKARVERTFKALVDEAEKFFAANDRKSITPRMHFAMDYLGLQAPWHQSTARMIACPNCGMLIRENLSYHKNEFGERCILNWQKAYEAGAVKKEDVPVEKRWWTEEDTEKAPRPKAK